MLLAPRWVGSWHHLLKMFWSCRPPALAPEREPKPLAGANFKCWSRSSDLLPLESKYSTTQATQPNCQQRRQLRRDSNTGIRVLMGHKRSDGQTHRSCSPRLTYRLPGLATKGQDHTSPGQDFFRNRTLPQSILAIFLPLLAFLPK